MAKCYIKIEGKSYKKYCFKYNFFKIVFVTLNMNHHIFKKNS